MREKIHSFLGFARKSRNIVSGYNSCEDAIKRNKVYLILMAGDMADNTIKKFEILVEDKKIPFRIYKDKETLSEMTGLPERGVFGIKDENLAQVILREIDGNR